MKNRTINLIAAVALDGTIGVDNKLPWKIKEDLDFYKQKTLGNVVIIGYNTYQSLPKVALKNRNYIVITSKKFDDIIEDDYSVMFVNSPNDAINNAIIEYDTDIFIAGGASIYKQLSYICHYAYITWVGEEYDDNAIRFPMSDFHMKFSLLKESTWKEENKYNYKFSTYKNINQ